MPSKSKKQAKLMAAVAHNADFAQRVGIPQSVGREFSAADEAVHKYAGGGKVKNIRELKEALDNWQRNKLPQKGFFSTLDEHIAQAPQASMPAFQWQNYLKAGRMLDRGGIQFPLKQEELNYGKIPELSDKLGANTNLTQDQVRDYVRENRPDLQSKNFYKYDQPGLRYKPSVSHDTTPYEENVTVSPNIGDFSSHFTPQDISWSRTTRHQLPGDRTARLIEEIQSDRHSTAGEKLHSFEPDPATRQRMIELYNMVASPESQRVLQQGGVTLGEVSLENYNRPGYRKSEQDAAKEFKELRSKSQIAAGRRGYRTPEQEQAIDALRVEQDALLKSQPSARSMYRFDHENQLIPPTERPRRLAEILDLEHRIGANSSKLRALKEIPPDAPFKEPRDYATHEIRKQLLNSVADNDRFLALTRGEDQIARYEQGMGNQESRGMQEMYDKVYPSVLAKEAGRYGATGVQDLVIPKIKTKSNIRPQAFVDMGAETPEDFRRARRGLNDPQAESKIFEKLLAEYSQAGVPAAIVDLVRDYPHMNLDIAHDAWKSKIKQSNRASSKSFPATELTPEVAQRIRDIGVPIFSLGAGAVAAPYYLTPNSEDPTPSFAEGGEVQGQPKTLDYWRAVADSLANAVPFTWDEKSGTQNKFGKGISDALSRVSSGLASQVLTRAPDVPGIPGSGDLHVGTHPGILDELAAFPDLLYSLQDTYSGADPTSFEPEFVKRGVENTSRNYKAAREGLRLKDPQGFAEHALESLGVMAGQLPIPGSSARKLAALTRTGSKGLNAAKRVLGAGAEWLSPTISPSVGNYVKGAVFGGTIGGATDALTHSKPFDSWPALAMQEVLNEGNMQTPYYIQANSDSTPQGYAGGGKVKSIRELKEALDNWGKNKLPQEGFFSTLDEHIAQAPQASMPAFQWQNYLKAGRMLDRGGIQFPLKQEELNYGKIPELADKLGANTNLTQDQVRDYVRQNRPDLQLYVGASDNASLEHLPSAVQTFPPMYNSSGLRFKPSVPDSYEENVTVSPNIGDFSSHFTPQDISWSRTTRHQLPGDRTARLIEEIQSDRHSTAGEKVEDPNIPLHQDVAGTTKLSDFLEHQSTFKRRGYRTPEQEQEIKDIQMQIQDFQKSPDYIEYLKQGRADPRISTEKYALEQPLRELQRIPPDAPFKDPRDYATHEIRKQLLNSVADNDRFLALTRGQDQIDRYEQGMGNQESRGMQEMYDKIYPSVLAKEAGRYGATGVQDLVIPKIKTKSNIRPQAFVDARAETPQDFMGSMMLLPPGDQAEKYRALLDNYSQAGLPEAKVQKVSNMIPGHVQAVIENPSRRTQTDLEQNVFKLHNAWKRKVVKDNPQAFTKSFPATELTPEVAQRIRDIGVPIFSLGAGAVAAPYYLTPNSENQDKPPQGFAAGGPADPKLPQLIPGGSTSSRGYYPLNIPEVLTLPPPGTPSSGVSYLPGANLSPALSTRDKNYTPLSPDWYAHYGEGPEHLFLGDQSVNLPNPNFRDNTTPIPPGAIPSGKAPSSLISGLTLGALGAYDAYNAYNAFSGAPSNTVIPAGPGTPASTGDDNEDSSGTSSADPATGVATNTPRTFGNYAAGALGAGLGALQLYGGIKAGGVGGTATALRGAGQIANAANTTGLYTNTYGSKLGAAGQTLAGVQAGGVRGYTQAAVGASNLASSYGYNNALTSTIGKYSPYIGAALALTGKGNSTEKAAGALSAIFPVLGIPLALQSLGAFGRPNMDPEKQQAIHNYAVNQGAVLVPKDPTHPASINYADPNSYTLDYTHHYETPAETTARIKADSGGNADFAKLLQQEGDYYIGPGATSSNHIAGDPSAIATINKNFQDTLADPAKLAELQKIPFFSGAGKTTEQITAEHGGVPWNAYGPISSLYWTPAQKAFMLSHGYDSKGNKKA